MSKGEMTTEQIRKKYKLTNRQLMFCHEYVKDFNGKRAAIESGYKPKVAHVSASENLNKHNVSMYLASLIAPKMKEANLTTDRIIQETCKIAFSDIKDFLSFDSSNGVVFKSSEEIEDTAAIAEVSSEKTKKTTKVRLKRFDKLKALQMLGEYLKLWKGNDIPDKQQTIFVVPQFNNTVVLDNQEYSNGHS